MLFVDLRKAYDSIPCQALWLVPLKYGIHPVLVNIMVYEACVLTVLLYGCECWIPLHKYLSRFNAFHHRCICTVLGITNEQQWKEHISSGMTRDAWGDPKMVATELTKQKLKWLAM